MPAKKITLGEGKILKKLKENSDGITMKDFKRDENFNVSERIIRDKLEKLTKKGKVSKETKKRKQDHRANIIYKSTA
ncbi:MAG: hypothetical protein Q8M92_09325 [Candidatus Subteraquimicrobiales bacterium]|nr:hypothetical protein [Candidatus Subteraquimicrobiales bacterium]